MRTKAVRPDHPDSGLQPRASKTVYLTRDHMNALAVPDGGGKVDFRIVQDRAGSLGRVIRNPDGRWGAEPSARNVPVEIRPRVGLYPLELWQPETIQGVTAYQRMHPGNAIIKIGPILHSP
jgi:hypothetical protein